MFDTTASAGGIQDWVKSFAIEEGRKITQGKNHPVCLLSP